MNRTHRLTRYSLLLIAVGLAINLSLSRLALYLELPLFLDSIGTVLAAALGGYLPGIIVGFFSNVVNGLSDPITMYYAIINILLACTASFLARRGWFLKLGKAALSVLCFSLIGGGLGSVLTWLLYGFSFGSGISAPFAIALHSDLGFSEFGAQFSADMVLDLADKTITVLFCVLALRVLPKRWMKKLSSGWYISYTAENEITETFMPRIRHSLREKVVLIISISALILSTSAMCIGFVLYTSIMEEHYTATATSVAEMAADAVNPEQISRHLIAMDMTEAYYEEEARLKAIRESVPDIEYIYVYQIREDGCHVIYDVDTPELPGNDLGTVIPIENAFLPYRAALLAGDSIPPIISNGYYGWLMTVYAPIKDAKGNTVAYAAADISMKNVMRDRTIFVIKMASLLFGVSVLIVAFALWFAERRLVDPINAIAKAANEFAYDGEQEREQNSAQIHDLVIRTGDEIENLYSALRKTVADITAYISDINRKNRIISHMQQTIILSFADMVESRDTCTGFHIKNTAAYVEVIARELLSEGRYADTITPAYIEKIGRSAPLHDLGKIEVPDAILNKPGKLTPDEFEIMKTHTTAGRKILLGIIEHSDEPDYLSEALCMATSHHERWDGHGYPEGLKGDDIPLSARIMAVADVYDALVSKRSYKNAMTSDQAVEIIQQESGTHFDPAVVSAFVRARDRIEAAKVTEQNAG